MSVMGVNWVRSLFLSAKWGYSDKESDCGPFPGQCVYAESGGIKMEMKNVLLASSAAAALVASGAANAGDYFTVFGGASFQSDVDGVHTSARSSSFLDLFAGVGLFTAYTSVTASMSAELETGFVLGVAYGRELNQHWRAELEMAYREFAVEDLPNVSYSTAYGIYGVPALTQVNANRYITGFTGTGTTKVPTYSTVISPEFGGFVAFGGASNTANLSADGSVSFFSIMANFWYDFNIVDNWETFIGAGIGVAQANANGIRVGIPVSHSVQRVVPIYVYNQFLATTDPLYKIPNGSYVNTYAVNDTSPMYLDGSDWVFAYQFGIGAGYTLENGVRLSAQYRYFGTDEAEIGNVQLQGEASEFLFGISFPLGN